MAFFKISDDTDTNWKDIQIHGRKYIANVKIPMVIGTDAAQTFEDGIKIVSVPLPTNKKLKLVKVNWTTQIIDQVTLTSNINALASQFHGRYNSFQALTVSADDENSFTNTVTDGDTWLARQASKFYTRLPYEHYEEGHNTHYYNAEIFNNNKLSYLNIYTRFSLTPGVVYADYNALLLAYYKLNVAAGISAALPVKFQVYCHIEVDILPEDYRRKMIKRPGKK